MNEKKISPEAMTERLQRALGTRLRSVLLYGSAAAGDFLAQRSDYNLLVVADQLGVEELKALSKPIRAWVKDGNPPPLCFTVERLKSSADVFPLEMLDLKERRRVLHGEDCIAGMELSQANLRHQLEYELKSRLIQLRERFLLVAGEHRQTLDLLTQSLSTFLVLFRGVLRLLGKEASPSKLEAVRLLGRELGFPVEAFETVHDLRSGARAAGGIDMESLFQQYLTAIEAVGDKVDRFVHPSSAVNQEGSEPQPEKDYAQ